VTTTATRLCEGCGEPLPLLSRPNRHHHDARCRARAARKRERRPLVLPGFGPAPPTELEAAVAHATEEVRLVGIVAAEAGRGSWRAAAWLLERQYPEHWGAARDVREVVIPPLPAGEGDPFREVDELASRRSRKPEGY
jgi:hypothetical protein